MTEIYLYDIEKEDIKDDFSDIHPLRKEYLNKISNKKRKKQSYFVWKLLEYALKKRGVNHYSFYNEQGRWGIVSNEVYFSLSHSNNLVCVAISPDFIGVDVEKVTDKLYGVEKRFTVPENARDKLIYLAERWTGEEARFKAGQDGDIKSFIVEDNSKERYCLSVCSNEEADIMFVKDIK